MSDPNPFADGPAAGDDAPYAWLDEWLCEYVDGTMDPALAAIFEQYVEANPDLKAHVESLRETRRLLCECGRPAELSCEARERACNRVQEKVCSQVESDLLQSRAPLSTVLDHSTVLVAGLSMSTVALILGLFAGAVLFGPSTAPPPTASDTPERIDRLEPSRAAVAPTPRAVPSTEWPPVYRHDIVIDTVTAPSSLPLTTIQAP
jgi:anti-sigma factor RsiW